VECGIDTFCVGVTVFCAWSIESGRSRERESPPPLINSQEFPFVIEQFVQYQVGGLIVREEFVDTEIENNLGRKWNFQRV
jgi:hypothetical protein